MDPKNSQIEIALPSALFPFRLEELSLFHFGPYTLQNVFQTISHGQKKACVELWMRNRVMPSEPAAWERSEEVCYYITEKSTGKLVGVNTLYVDNWQHSKNRYLFNRMFIDPAFRNSRLMIVATAMTTCYAKLNLAKFGISGVINVNENVKLARKGIVRIFLRLGYQKIGTQEGKDVWLYDFSKITIRES